MPFIIWPGSPLLSVLLWIGVAVAFPSKEQLSSRTPASQRKCQTSQDHPQKIPEMIAMGNWLRGETEFHLSQRKIGQQCRDE
jgi:hypothetical protein